MSMMGAQLVAKVSVEGDAEAKQKLQGVSDKAKETSGGFKEMLTHGLEITGVFAAFDLAKEGVRMLGDQIGDVIKVTEAHQLVAAQMVQVLKSTRDVSGMTADALDNLAQSFSKTTMFSADTVLGGENLLLTFTNIGKSVFPQATQAILDVSQAMGQDLKSSAIQVGKALGDPLTGMTALQRIGVTFSASEKEQIKTMMAHNDIIGAQKVILHELSTEFGGSATAAGKTFGGQMDILKNSMEELKIKIGEQLMPYLTRLIGFLTDKGMPLLTRLSDWFTKSAMPVLTQFGNWLINQAIPYLQGFATTIERSLLPPLEDLAGNVIGLAKQFGEWLVNSGLLTFAVNALSSVLGTLVSWISDVIAGLQDGNPLVSTLVGLLAAVGTEIGLIKLQAFAADLFASFNQLKSGAGIIANLTTQAFPALSNALGVTKTAVAGVGEAATAAEGATKVAAVGMSAAMGIATLGFSLAAGVLVTAFMMAKDHITTGAHQMSTDVQAIYNSLGTTEADTIAKSAAKQVETMHSTATQSVALMENAGSRSSAAWTSSFQKTQQASDDAKAKMILAQQQIADKAVASAARADAAWVSASQQMSLVALLAAAGWTGPQIAAYTGQGQNQFQKGPAPKGSFAEGGPVLETGLALVHKGEFVIPASLARNFSYSPGYGGAGIAPSSGGMTQVNLQINGYTFARLMLPSIVQAIRTNIGITNI